MFFVHNRISDTKNHCKTQRKLTTCRLSQAALALAALALAKGTPAQVLACLLACLLAAVRLIELGSILQLRLAQIVNQILLARPPSVLISAHQLPAADAIAETDCGAKDPSWIFCNVLLRLGEVLQLHWSPWPWPPLPFAWLKLFAA